VAEVCKGAGCSVGTFYGRVESKDALLEHLRARMYGEASTALEAVFDPSRWGSSSLRDMLESQARAMVQLHHLRRGVIRAVVVQARRRQDLGEPTIEFNRLMVERVIATWMSRADEIKHLEPERAIREALLMANGYLREAVVFGELWPGGEEDSVETHTRAVTRLLTNYLT
jgi:AcrR family transcriptional regulator